MIQPIQNRYPATSNSGSGSGLHLAPGKKPPHIGYPPEDHSADDSSVAGYRVESPQYETPKYPDDNPEILPISPETALQKYKREKANYESRGRGKETALVQKKAYKNHVGQPGQQIAQTNSTGLNNTQNFNQNMAVTNVSLTVNATINTNLSPTMARCPQQMGHLSPRHPSPMVQGRPRPVISPSHPAFQDEQLFVYGDDRSVSKST